MISQYPERTGSGVYFRSVIKELSKLNYSQSALYAVNSGDKFDLGGIGVEREYVLEFGTDEIPFNIPGMSDTMPYKSVKYCDMTEDMMEVWKKSFKEKILESVEDYKPDVVVTHHLWAMTGLVAELIKDIPVIAFCHGTDIRQLKKGCKYRDYIVKNCRKLDWVYALSSEQKHDISELYGIDREKIEVIGGGFDSEKFHLADLESTLRKDRVKAVYVGKLSYSKGVSSLLKAYEKLEDDLELILVGNAEGEEGERVMAEIRKCEKKLTLKGQVSQDELADLFRDADLFVLPSFYEGLSLVTVEALASGLRVVVSRLNGIHEYLGEALNDSGLIEYVQLPKLKNVDEPVEDGLEGFEEGIRMAIERQISRLDRIKDREKFTELYPRILEKAWNGIARKLDKKMKSLEFRQ